MLAAYVSGHGFGHSTRTAEVLRVLRRQRPDLPLAVVTSAPEKLYRESIPGPLTFRDEECDVGLAQHSALAIDAEGTVARWRAFMAEWPRRVEREAAWLREHRVRLVFGDIPPLAFAAAHRAGVPSVAMANFSWDWIFAHVARHAPALAEAAEWAAGAYRCADQLLRLPFYGDMSVFRRIDDIPLVARRPSRPRAELRARLSLRDRPAALLSFGGLGGGGIDVAALGRLDAFTFVVSDTFGEMPANFRRIDRDELTSVGLRYVDVVGAADVVITKPGYGIVSDCIGAGTPIVYTDRGDFPEYPVLVEGMRRVLPCEYVTHEQLAHGAIGDVLERLVAVPVPPPPDLDGAERAAEHLLARLA